MKTLLVVEDEKNLRMLYKHNLTDEGYHVLVAENGNEAIEMYRKHKPDLITLDITMPNKTGADAMKEIIQEFPNANVLMISAVRGDAMLECMNGGAKGYIEKPLKFNDPEFVSDFKDTIQEIFED